MATVTKTQDKVELPPAPLADERIYADNSNVADLKATCDEAVERILTRPANPLPPAPSASPLAAGSPVDDQPNDPLAQQPNPPFKVSHWHADFRLALGYIGSISMILVALWSYFVEKSWKNNKGLTGIAVVFYVALSAVQTIDAYIQGNRIFIGKRKTLSNRIETEHLTISSPPLPKAIATTSSDGKKTLTPPAYSLEVDYTRTSNGGKSLIRRAKETVQLGDFGQWFTEEGEFVQELFEQRLIGVLQEVWHRQPDSQ